MAPPKRATGANVKRRIAFELNYGQKPGGNWIEALAYSYDLSEVQPLDDNPLLGQGREPSAPDEGAIDDNGNVVVPIDQRLFGHSLRHMFGDAAAAIVGARGWIEFGANPTAADTITLDGVAWTFVAAGAAGEQTDIGLTLQATLDQLVTDLNASADPDIAAATYSRLGDRLVIEHDTADATGNAYTLAASITGGSKLSAATLTGGGLVRHTWNSGAVALPSMADEVEHADLEAGSTRFTVHEGILLNTMTIERSRNGTARATLALVGQKESEFAASQAGAPTSPAIDFFSQFQGVLLVDGQRVASIQSGTLTLGNNLIVDEDIGNEGYIGGADPGPFTIGLNLVARHTNSALKDAVSSKTAVEIRYGFRNAITGAELEIQLHALRLPKPRRSIAGPGGIDVTYESRGQKGVTYSATVRLWNDQAAGTYAAA